jgi:molybdopterin molybdotransferase
MEGNMISPKTALKSVMKLCDARGTASVAAARALGHVLAENLEASEPFPRFDNSAMDGFAIRSADTASRTKDHPASLEIVDTVFAGQVGERQIRRGEACRIMTGAPIPPGADAVAPKEVVTVEGTRILIGREVKKGHHIRGRGEEVKSGDVVIRQGVTVDAGVTACIASLGRARVRVFRKPTVAVIATGDETVAPGRRLRPGQIYDSNSYMLTAALRQMGMAPIRVRHVGDRPSALQSATAAAIRAADVLVVTGGISVGDRDYLREVLGRQGVKEVFWRVKQKPGKPLYFGVRGRRIVFGLPGNPASVFTCFYAYVYPALRRMAGHGDTSLPERRLPLAGSVKRDPVRWRFLKAKTVPGERPAVRPLSRQASHMISALVETDRLIVVPPGDGSIDAGTIVSTWSLPAGRGGAA